MLWSPFSIWSFVFVLSAKPSHAPQSLKHYSMVTITISIPLFQVSMKTEVTWARDMLRGDDAFELQLKLLKQVPEEYPYKDDE